MRSVLLAIAMLGFACAGPIRASMSPVALMNAVEKAEGDRDGHSPAITRALSSHHRSLRLAALRAVARTEEVGTSSGAITLLGDRDREVGAWAAFALGQIGEPAGEAALRASMDGISLAPDQVLLALGRLGTATTARDVAKALKDEHSEVRRAAAISLGLLGKRLKKELPVERYAKLVVPLTSDPDPRVRFGAAYALMRLEGPTAAIALISLLTDMDAEVRSTAVRGIGASGAAPQVLDQVMSDPDWRVRVELAKALGEIGRASPPDASAASARLSALIPREFGRFKRSGVLNSGRATHVLVAVVAAAVRLGPEGLRVIEQLERTPWNMEGLPQETGADLARLKCAVAFALDSRDRKARRVKRCGDASLPAWRRYQLEARLYALASNEGSVHRLVQMAHHQDPRVRATAVEALGQIERPSSVQALTRLLDSNDPYVLSAAAEILSRPDRARFRPAGLVDKLRRVIKLMVGEADPSLVVGVIDAIGALGADGKMLLGELEGLADDPRAPIRRRSALAREAITGRPVLFGGRTKPLGRPAPRPIGRRVRLNLETVRGEIQIELLGDVAPRTTGTIVSLAKSGFYTNKTFHRIVSNFVAQGGCPRGDGWGGPGYTIDDETSPLPFARGTVGIATNGRDTGGSQLFIMHSYHPHLDGGYTLVGRVVKGIEAVDALQQDDRILKVRVEDGRSSGITVR